MLSSFRAMLRSAQAFLDHPAGIWILLGGALVASAGVFLGFRHLARPRGAPRPKLPAFALSMALVGGLFAAITVRLPEGRGVPFHWQYQVVSNLASLAVLVLTVSVLGLLVPTALDFFEGQSFNGLVAARHVRSNKTGFLRLISVLAIGGVAISSFLLCVVISVMGGFGADLKQKILNNSAQIRIEKEGSGGFEYYREALDQVRMLPGVLGATPVVSGEVMASSTTTTAGVLLRGVDLDSIGSVIDIPHQMAEEKVKLGGFEYLAEPEKLQQLPPHAPIGFGQSGEIYFRGTSGADYSREEGEERYPGVVLGAELAKSLHAYVTDVITLVSPMGDLGPGGIMPRIRKFRVAGIFYSGMYEYDATLAFVTLDRAQEIFDKGHFISTIDVRVRDIENVEKVAQSVRAAVGRPELTVVDWKQINRNLFFALKLEKLAGFVILSIAILVASFCIICILLLMVTEKSKEIAILKAMGASDGAVLRLFLTEGVFIGGVGTIFGVVSGLSFMMSLKKLGFRLDPEVYYVYRLPVLVEISDYLLITLCAFLITTIATLYPARAASRLRPVEGIRYE